MDTWEETVIEDTFPEAGEIYFLRPRGNIPSVIEREGKWGTYSMIKGMFWIYTDQDKDSPNITRESPMIAHSFMVKPTVLYEFVGKWDDTKVFQCVCRAIGKITRLVIEKTYKAPVMHPDPQPPTPPTPPMASDMYVGGEQERPPKPQAGDGHSTPPSDASLGEEMKSPAACSHPPLDRTYTSDTVYICGVCNQRVVVI
jgi:hypothetical protein